MTDPKVSDPLRNSQPVTLLGEFSKKFVTNTFFNVLGRSWSFLTALLLTPYILSHLGVNDFGMWVLLTVFINWFNLFELGLGSSFVKYISAYYTHRDYDRINHVLFSGLLFYSAFGVLLVFIGLALEPLFSWFRMAPAPGVYFLILMSCALQNIATMFLSVFKGIQRMDKSNTIEITLSLVNVGGTVLFLEAGFGMLGLAINALLSAVIAVFVTWLTVARVLPELSLGWHYDGKLLRAMFGYGAKMQVSRLGGMVCFQMDKLIISRLMGTAAVSFYEVSSRLTSFMRAVPLVMLSALIPATSELGARNDREKILRTYWLASRYVAMVTVALVAYVVLEAESLVTLWLGKGFEQSAVLIRILAIGYGVNALGGAASQTGAGVGRPEFDMRSTVLLMTLNPILSMLLVRQFGAAGAAAGTSAALVISAVYLLVIFHQKYVEASVWTALRGIYARPILSAGLASLAVLVVHREIPGLPALADTRFLIPLKVLADFLVFAPVYMVLLVAFRQVTAIDRKNFIGLMAFAFEFIRHPFRERVKIYR